uniref:Uncharacterized protein n=1 Tax=Candidozyma auris TaxID=498019 RepID=A0A0L0P0R6_CANAR
MAARQTRGPTNRSEIEKTPCAQARMLEMANKIYKLFSFTRSIKKMSKATAFVVLF